MNHVKVLTQPKDMGNILNSCNMCNNNNNIFYCLSCIYINHEDTTLSETCNLLLAGYCAINVVVLDGSFINEFL